jgi:glucose-1-phosphate adenylyltransferase
MSSGAAAPKTHAFVLAGGQGERLHPLTLSRPKPLIPFAGSFRIIDFTLSNCLNSHLYQVSLLTQYKSEALHAYIRDAWAEVWRVSACRGEGTLKCLAPTSGKRYRGTADAVFHNMPILDFDRPEYVLVLAGDHVYEIDYRDLIRRHAETDADLTIAAVEFPLQQAQHFGVLEVDEQLRVIGFEEKPIRPRPLPTQPTMALISMGVYVFKANVLLHALFKHCGLGRVYDFGHNVIPEMIRSHNVFAYDFRDEQLNLPRYWRDIGTVDSYYEACMDLVRPHPRFNAVNDAWPLRSAAYLRVTPTVARSAHVTQSVVSGGVHIEEDAVVHRSVLMPGVRVGKGVRLGRTIVEENVTIPDGFQAGFDLQRDRCTHAITENGVVVIGNSPKVIRFPAGRRRQDVNQASM